MSGLRLRDEDIEDAKYIAECFGKQINLSNDALDILYVTLPGTTEVNYATQTFPAVILKTYFSAQLYTNCHFLQKLVKKKRYTGQECLVKNLRKERFSC